MPHQYLLPGDASRSALAQIKRVAETQIGSHDPWRHRPPQRPLDYDAPQVEC